MSAGQAIGVEVRRFSLQGLPAPETTGEAGDLASRWQAGEALGRMLCAKELVDMQAVMEVAAVNPELDAASSSGTALSVHIVRF